jgi:quinohemoprotein ethanol dehydrogenase
MATGGNLVFQGQLDGKFNAYTADKGKLVWSFDAKAPILAPPISYAVAGRQYVTVMTGASGSRTAMGKEFSRFDIDYRTQARRVLTFVVGGKAVLPPRSPSGLKPIDDPGYGADAALAAKGAAIYGRCAACHGREAVAGGAAPDLRASPVPLDPDTFRQIVKDGGLVAAGMPHFPEVTDEQLAQLRQYLRAQAAEWRKRLPAPAQ